LHCDFEDLLLPQGLPECQCWQIVQVSWPEMKDFLVALANRHSGYRQPLFVTADPCPSDR